MTDKELLNHLELRIAQLKEDVKGRPQSEVDAIESGSFKALLNITINHLKSNIDENL